MASNYGFVYVLRNICMPGIYKIGMTDRAQSQRAAELSNSTSVPIQFDLVCFAEVMDALAYERSLHDRLESRRVSASREFFALTGDDIRDLIGSLEEDATMVARGDLSFLHDSKCSGVIGRAQREVESESLRIESEHARLVSDRGGA